MFLPGGSSQRSHSKARMLSRFWASFRALKVNYFPRDFCLTTRPLIDVLQKTTPHRTDLSQTQHNTMSTHCTSLALLFFACSASAEILSTDAQTLQLTIPDEHRFLKVINLQAQDMPSSCAGGSFFYNVKNYPILFKGTPTGIEHEELDEEIAPGRQVQSGTVQFAGLSKWSIDVGYNVSNLDTFQVTLSATCDISVDITPEWYVIGTVEVASAQISNVTAEASMTLDFTVGGGILRTPVYFFVQSVWLTTESDKAGCEVPQPAYHLLYKQPYITTPYIFRDDACVGCSSSSGTFYPMTGMHGDQIVVQFSTMDLTGCLDAPVLKTGATVRFIDFGRGVVSPPPVADAPLSGGVCAPIVTLLVAAIALVLA